MTPAIPPGTELVRPGGVRIGDRLLISPGTRPWWQPRHRWHGRTLAWSTRSPNATLTTVRETDQYTDFYTTGAATVVLLLTDHGLIVTTPTNALLRTAAEPPLDKHHTEQATPRPKAKRRHHDHDDQRGQHETPPLEAASRWLRRSSPHAVSTAPPARPKPG